MAYQEQPEEAEDLSKGAYVHPKKKKRKEEKLVMLRDCADISNRVWTGLQGEKSIMVGK